ncbi:MAG: hypothetical protein KC445_15305 [Anaerolineales bacterium]|nr:hypothetical protein [Anaerolineales bacterium]
MTENNDTNLMEKNLDRLSDFLNQELDHPTLGTQIPNGAHIFHGSYNDKELTQGNLNLATKLLLGMTLGYVEDAPLVMLFEYEQGKQTVVDLSETIQKQYIQTFIGRFQQQSQKKMRAKINQLATAA